MKKHCYGCKKIDSCDILAKIKTMINIQEWGCSNWNEKEKDVYLIDVGQRLYDYHEFHPEILKLLDLTLDDFFNGKIDPKYEGSIIRKVTTINNRIVLVFIPEEKKYALMNKKGINEASWSKVKE